MNNLRTYIIEKLRINKKTITIDNTNYIDEIIDIIGDDNISDEIINLIETWIGDYNKKLYCYVSKFEYQDLKKDANKYDKISINCIDEENMKRGMKLADGSTIYKRKNKEMISKITSSQYDLAIYLSSFFPILFEKTKI